MEYNRTAKRVGVKWNEPEQPNGIIVGYEVNMSSNDGLTYFQSLNAGMKDCKIPVQLLCKEYIISLAAKTIIGTGISEFRYFNATIEGLKLHDF